MGVKRSKQASTLKGQGDNWLYEALSCNVQEDDQAAREQVS
jgi:hypothetical protein